MRKAEYVDIEEMKRLLKAPILSIQEWESFCDPPADFGAEIIHNHCSLTVIVDCPPDCGVFKILKEDKLAH